MRVLLLTLLSIMFITGSIFGQQKVSKSETKAIVKELSHDQKMRLLSKLLKEDSKTLAKTLTKLIRKADKAEIDAFMGKKDMVFKPMNQSQENGKPAKVVEKRSATSNTSKKETKTVTKTKETKQKVVNGRTTVDQEKTEVKTTSQSASSTSSSPKPTYVFKDKSAGPVAEIEWDEMTFDYGTITDGESVTHTYKFKNVGDVPYFISNAKGSCGCTVPKWPNQPIPPGGTGEIIVTFNSRGKGKPDGANQNKRVTITGNTNPAQTYLSIKGIVKK